MAASTPPHPGVAKTRSRSRSRVGELGEEIDAEHLDAEHLDAGRALGAPLPALPAPAALAAPRREQHEQHERGSVLGLWPRRPPRIRGWPKLALDRGLASPSSGKKSARMRRLDVPGLDGGHLDAG